MSSPTGSLCSSLLGTKWSCASSIVVRSHFELLPLLPARIQQSTPTSLPILSTDLRYLAQHFLVQSTRLQPIVRYDQHVRQKVARGLLLRSLHKSREAQAAAYLVTKQYRLEYPLERTGLGLGGDEKV